MENLTLADDKPVGEALIPVAIKCNGAEDVVRCLQQAAQSASPVALDLNQMTLAQPELLDALRKLCTSAASHVTLSNGLVVLQGKDCVLSITCSRLSFKRMEIVHEISASPPPPPKARAAAPHSEITPEKWTVHAANGMLYIQAAKNGRSTHVTLEDCTLRMEGDPRYNLTPAVVAIGCGSQLRMDRCKLYNMHPVMMVMEGAQVALHSFHLDLVFGILQPITVTDAGSKLSLYDCTLVEEEGPCLPPASSLQRLNEKSIVITEGGFLQLECSRVRMPLGAQLGRVPYTLACTNGHLTATDTTFDGSFIALIAILPGCRFTRCAFKGFHSSNSSPAFHARVKHGVKHHALAVMLCDGVSGLMVEDCTFTNTPDRVGLQCCLIPSSLPPLGGPPLIHVKGCSFSSCFVGIEVCGIRAEFVCPTTLPSCEEEQSMLSVRGRLTVEVEDTTIEVAASTLEYQGERACLFLYGPASSICVRRCELQARGASLSAVVACNGARLVLTDSTVTLHGPCAAISLGRKDAPADPAVIERTIITADLEEPDDTSQVIPVVVFTRDGTTTLIDCKIQGSASHSGVTVRGPGKITLVRCEIAPERPMLMAWAAVEPKGTVILKDCIVGECEDDADVYDGTLHLLDNTPYPLWTDHLAPHNPPPAARQIIFLRGFQDVGPASLGMQLTAPWLMYINERPTPNEKDGSLGGSGESTTTAVAAGTTGGSSTAGAATQQPLVAPGAPWWPTKCMGCDNTGNLSWCQGCTCVQFCSRGCQKRCWSKHKPFCQYISQHYGQAAERSNAEEVKVLEA